MPNDSPPTLEPRKPTALWSILAIFLLLIGMFALQLFGPNPQTVVTHKTTFVTGPLRPDGLPNYRQYMLNEYRLGVSPDNNSANLLWQAILPDDITPAQMPLLCNELGISPVAKHNTFATLDDDAVSRRIWVWFCNRHGIDSSPEYHLNRMDTCEEIIEQAKSREWKGSECTPLKTWIEENGTQLDQIAQASWRSTFYSPASEWLLMSDEPLINTYPSGMYAITQATDGLLVRAMRNLGDGHPDEAWADISSVYRLANLVGENPGLVELLWAFRHEEQAQNATFRFLTSQQVSIDQLRRALQDLVALSDFPDLATRFDQSERVRGLDAIQYASLGKTAMLLDALEIGPQVTVVDHVSIDWNVVMQDFNVRFDHWVSALKQPTYQARRGALDKLEADEWQESAQYQNMRGLTQAILSRTWRNRFLGFAAFSVIRSSSHIIEADAANKARRGLAQTVAALAIYQKVHNQYPFTLDKLSPDFLPVALLDPFVDSAFIYRRINDGYLLFSVGPNGLADGGSNEMLESLAGQYIVDFPSPKQEAARQKIPAGADDISFRLPTPPFKLPEPPADP
jgi:hypothetical protein